MYDSDFGTLVIEGNVTADQASYLAEYMYNQGLHSVQGAYFLGHGPEPFTKGYSDYTGV